LLIIKLLLRGTLPRNIRMHSYEFLVRGEGTPNQPLKGEVTEEDLNFINDFSHRIKIIGINLHAPCLTLNVDAKSQFDQS